MTNYNDTLGFFTDHLSQEEVDFCKNAAEVLRINAPWATKLLNDPKIARAINITKDKNRSASDTKQLKAALFEVRFAYGLYQIGYTADYEYLAGIGNSTVDFKVNNDPTWLVELTSLREGEAVKAATNKNDKDIYFYASLTKPGENAPEVIDIVRAQRAICSKISDINSQPTKFPAPTPEKYHMIIIDIRSFNAGGVDPFDYLNIAYGSKILTTKENGVFCRFWIDETGKEELFKGLFDGEHPDPNSKLIRERIHALGFIAEDSYEDNILMEKLEIMRNPLLFKTKEEFLKVLPKELAKNAKF